MAKPSGLGKLAPDPLGRDGSNPKWGRDLADHDGRTDQTPMYRPTGKRTKGLASAFGAANPQEDENPGVCVKNVVQFFALCEPFTVDSCKITAEVGLTERSSLGALFSLPAPTGPASNRHVPYRPYISSCASDTCL